MTSNLAEELDVSRETLDKLEAYVGLLEKWNLKINLVGRSTLADVWTRHIADSVQIYRAGPEEFSYWLDLGSGAGLPGVVVAILANENTRQRGVGLVESDRRKAAFLRAALREAQARATVLSERIENLPPQKADVVSARALADLETLLCYADRHMAVGGTALFAKGAAWEKEVDAAQGQWSFNYEALRSKTEEGAVVLRIGDITRV